MADTNKLLKIITLLLSVLLIGSSFQLYSSLEKTNLQNQTITSLIAETNSQKETISGLEISVNNLKQNVSRTETLLKNETQRRAQLEEEIINLTMVAKSNYGVLAVDENDNGHVIPLEVIIKEGKGNLFLNVANVLFDETLQSSAQTAVHVARDVTRTSLVDKDILINIEAPAEAQGLVISGGSAGSAMTLAAMAAMQGKTLRKDVLITGTIREDHTIGRIGAARAKGLAAVKNGAVLFLVPETQKSEMGEIGIEVREVSTIEDAARYAFPSS
ncbi:MAG: hypothetical protein PHU34_09245 [Candidatus Methanoperedens sp.]|nr:hypothetical protein [Candidatus Methanoperedens sp.]